MLSILVCKKLEISHSNSKNSAIVRMEEPVNIFSKYIKILPVQDEVAQYLDSPIYPIKDNEALRSTHDPAGNRGFCGHTHFLWTSGIFVGTHASRGRTKIELFAFEMCTSNKHWVPRKTNFTISNNCGPLLNISSVYSSDFSFW